MKKYILISIWSFIGFLLNIIYFIFTAKYVSNYYPVGWLSKDQLFYFKIIFFHYFLFLLLGQ